MGIGSGFDLGGSCMLLGGGGRVLNLFPRGVSCLRSPSSWPPSPSAVLPAAAEMLSVWAFCLSALVGQSELCSCCRLLGHSRPRAVPEHACLLLPQGPRLHHGMKPAGRQRLRRSGLRGEGMGAWALLTRAGCRGKDQGRLQTAEVLHESLPGPASHLGWGGRGFVAPPFLQEEQVQGLSAVSEPNTAPP